MNYVIGSFPSNSQPPRCILWTSSLPEVYTTVYSRHDSVSDNLFVESGLGGRCAGIIFYTSKLIVFSEEDTFIMNDVMYSSSARPPEEARERKKKVVL